MPTFWENAKKKKQYLHPILLVELVAKRDPYSVPAHSDKTTDLEDLLKP